MYSINGAIPSVEDNRDYPVEQLIGKSSRIPNNYQTDIPYEVFNQLESNECVACSLALVRYIQEYNQSQNREKFSPTYIYGNRSEKMFKGEGMSPREALKTIQDFGVVHYSDLPDFYTFDESFKLYNDNKSILDEKAYPFRISSYYRVDPNNRIEIKHSIMELKAITAMFPVFESLYEPKKDGRILYDENDKNICGYHEMTIIGWTANREWIVQNSWGMDYGIESMIFVPFEYPIVECWACVDDITEKKYLNN